MPRVALTQEQKQEARCRYLAGKITGKAKETGVQLQEIAKSIGISPAGMTYRLNSGTFRYHELVIIFDLLKFTEREIQKIMTK